MKPHIALIGSGSYGAFIEKAVQTLDVTLSRIAGREARVRLNNHPATHIILATPNYTHFDLVSAVLEAGKHVLCEKPLALTVEEVESLYKLAEAKQCYLGVGFVLPNHPFYQWLKAMQATHGGIRAIEVCNHATEGELDPEWYWNKAQSGGWFMVAEIHWYHLYLWLTGQPKLKLVTGSEQQEDGRTKQVWSTLEPADPVQPRLSIHHRLDMTHQTHWTKAEFFFHDGTQIVIDDWVPQSLNCHFEQREKSLADASFQFPSYISQSDSLFTDMRPRDDRYLDFVRDNIKNMLANQPQDKASIILAHKIALQAQENAN